MEIIAICAVTAVPLLIGAAIGYWAGVDDEKRRRAKLPPEVITYHHPMVDDCGPPPSEFELRIVRGGKSA